MAELTLKVSEDKVMETIQQLTSKIGSMEGHLDQLIVNREKLEKAYTGITAGIAIRAIKNKEKEAKNAIQKYKNQRDKLVEYIEKMNAVDARLASTYEAASNKRNELFGE